jgi:hypothetical protein
MDVGAITITQDSAEVTDVGEQIMRDEALLDDNNELTTQAQQYVDGVNNDEPAGAEPPEEPESEFDQPSEESTDDFDLDLGEGVEWSLIHEANAMSNLTK